MNGMTGMAQTIGAYTNGIGFVSPSHNTFHFNDAFDETAAIARLSLSHAPEWAQLPLAIAGYHIDKDDPTVIHCTRLHLVVFGPEDTLRNRYESHWQAALRAKHVAIPRQELINGVYNPIFLYGYAPDKCQRPVHYVMPQAQKGTTEYLFLRYKTWETINPTALKAPFLPLPGIHFFDA